MEIIKNMEKKSRQVYDESHPVDEDPMDDPVIRKHPTYIYGFGIVMYLRIIWELFILFALLSFLQMPAIVGNFLMNPGSSLNHLNLGNVGYSGSYCASTSVVTNKIKLECYGSVLEAIDEVGANPSVASPHHCEKNEENKECVGPKGNVEAQFAECKGKHVCNIQPGPASGGEFCGTPLAHVFVSYTCVFHGDEHEFPWKRLLYGFGLSCLNVFVGVVYFL
jgi:hypothetical protein